MLSKIFMAILLATFLNISLGQVEDREAEDLKSREKILESLDNVEKVSMENFVSSMEVINNETAEYISVKEQECSGEYTSFTINEQGDKIFQKNKLTKKEKKLCKYLLINFQMEVTKKSFKVRKEFLRRTHNNQIQKLDELEKKRLTELESTASKYK